MISDLFDPSVTKKIINDIANSDLSSFQIAYKFHIMKIQVDKIGRDNLGSGIYNEREKLATQRLINTIRDYLNKGYDNREIQERIGITKSSCYKFIADIRAQNFRPALHNDDEVTIVSQSELENGPVAALPAPDKMPSEPTADNSSSEGYRYRRSYHEYHHGYRRNQANYVRFNVRGILISFDAAADGVEELVMRIIREIKK